MTSSLSKRAVALLLPTKSSSCRFLHATSTCLWQGYENERHFEPGEDVLKRTWHGLTYDFRRWKRRYQDARRDAWQRRHPIAHMKHGTMDHEVFPFRAEVLVIGGGLTGSSCAYWLKQRFRDEDFKVVVLENNDRFQQSSSMLSVGGITQQHSIPEHIEMSLFTAEFLRHAGEHLRILDSDPPDINIYPCGYLHLACSDEDAEKMRETWKLQIEKGARVALLTRTELEERFPTMCFDGVVLGSLGLENEGVVDTWQLLGALREKNISLGVQYVKAEVEGFEFERHRTRPEVHAVESGEEADEESWRAKKIIGVYARPQMTDASPRPIRAHMIVCAAGPWAGRVAEMAGIGKGSGLLAVPVPIKPRKRCVFVLHVPDAPVDLPSLVLPSGVWLRQEGPGHSFLAGKHLTAEEDATVNHDNLDVNYDLFYQTIWPELVKHVPSFEQAKIKSAWAAYQDVNVFDGTPLIGEHPLYGNLHFAAGFGERGAQHALAVGRAFSEKVFEGAYVNINLRKFDMRRIVKYSPLEETIRA